MRIREVHIYGGGMSGMIAAYSLAREGFKVIVHERESGFGGSSDYNPSTHVTPIDPAATSKYVGLDISKCFTPVSRPIPFYFNETKIVIPQKGFYAVERGTRPSSIDSLLYAKCLEAGVDFMFDSKLTPDIVENPKHRTIVACGLTPSVYRMLDIPHLNWEGYISRGTTNISNYAFTWWGDCVTEYGYFSSVKDYYFNLLFSTSPVGKNCLERYKRFLVREEGIEHDNWKQAAGVVPLASPNNPRLFHKGLILCGTISGLMDPMFWFGISGALVSGKVAALAVTDPERAELDFNRFTSRFTRSYFMKNRFWYKYFRPKANNVQRVLNFLGTENVNTLLRELGILALSGKIKQPIVPGFGPYNTEHSWTVR